MLDGSPVRVIHVFNTLGSGGLQRVVLALSDWSARTHGVESILLSRGGALESKLDELQARWIRKDTSLGPLSEFFQLLRLTRQFRPHVLHAHQRHDALLCHAVGKLTGVRVIEHAHNTLPKMTARALSFRSDPIFAVSDQVKLMIVRDFGRDAARVRVIGGVPFNTSDEHPPARKPTASRPRVIVGIGRLEEQKDPHRFVKVIAAARRHGPVIGRWLGSGSLEAECKQLASDLGAEVEFVGESSDIVGELDRSDGLLITSRWEGLGLVILESFARHRPVVGLQIGGMGTLLSDDRGVALPAASTDDEIAAALWGATDDGPVSRSRVQRAAEYVTSNATPDSVYGTVVTVYREIASAKIDY